MAQITMIILTHVCSPIIFSENWSLSASHNVNQKPAQPEEKPKPTVTITDTQAKKFRPLSEKELEFYGSLDWETNPPINGFYETMMTIAHRQLAEMEAERQAMEAAKKETITEDGTIIEISKGDFVPKPRVASEAPKPSSVICRPVRSRRIFSSSTTERLMVVDNGQVGFLSGGSQNGATFSLTHQTGAGETRHALCYPVGNLSATLSL